MVKAASRIAVFGREREREHVAQFLDEIRRGPAILLIEGEAGIGKTTLWKFGVEDAVDRGHEVLVSRAGEAETKLAYTALGDLLGPADDAVIAELPDPQRKALEAALLLAETPLPAPDQRAVSLATRAAVLRDLIMDRVPACAGGLGGETSGPWLGGGGATRTSAGSGGCSAGRG